MEITVMKDTDQNVYCTLCPRHCYLYTLAFTNETTNEQGETKLVFAPADCPLKENL